MTTPNPADQLGRKVAESLRGLAADLEGSTPNPDAVPDLPEVVAQLRRTAAVAENAQDRAVRSIALRATHQVARLGTPFHEAKAGADLGVYSTGANPNYAGLAAEARGDFGPDEGLDPPPPPAPPTPRSGHSIEALGDVADAMREALARQEAKGYRDDMAVIDDVTRQLTGRATDRAGAAAAAALEYVAADQADASLPAELRDLPDDQRAELLREAGEVKQAAGHTEREPETTALGRDYGAGTAHTTSKEETMDNQANERPQDPAGRNPDQERLEALAAECERGAETLAYEAEHAGEVLATRANGDLTDPQERAERKRAAEATARSYAGRLRGLVADTGRVDADFLQQAEKVADAANLGGILIDGSRLDAASSERPFATTAEREATHRYSQQKRAAVEGSGLFAHVAEPGQVPYWQLGGQADRADAAGRTAPTARDSAESATPAGEVHLDQGTADTAPVSVDAGHTAAAESRGDTSSVMAKVQRANEAVVASRQPGSAAESVLGSPGRDVGLVGPQLGR